MHLTKEAQPVCEELLKLRQRLADIMYQDITEEEKQIMLKVAQKIASNINRELGTF